VFKIRIDLLTLLRSVLRVASQIVSIGGLVLEVMGQRQADGAATGSTGQAGPSTSSSFSSTSASSTKGPPTPPPAFDLDADRLQRAAEESAARAAGQ
jgi:hypothetical protein